MIVPRERRLRLYDLSVNSLPQFSVIHSSRARRSMSGRMAHQPTAPPARTGMAALALEPPDYSFLYSDSFSGIVLDGQRGAQIHFISVIQTVRLGSRFGTVIASDI
jgi:hypothetical protein